MRPGALQLVRDAAGSHLRLVVDDGAGQADALVLLNLSPGHRARVSKVDRSWIGVDGEVGGDATVACLDRFDVEEDAAGNWRTSGGRVVAGVIRVVKDAQVLVAKPFAGYKDFDACVADQVGSGHSDESAQRICSAIQATAEKAAGEARKALVFKKLPFKKDGDERYALGVVLEPDPLDGRGDLQGDTYSADEVRGACHDFMANYGGLGLNHEELVNGKITLLENYVAPVDMDVGGQAVKKGTWLMALRYNDDAIWEKVKSGEYSGLSIGGDAVRRPVSGA